MIKIIRADSKIFFRQSFPMHFFRADSKICDFLIVRHSPYNPSVLHTCFCKQAFNACPNHCLSALLKANAKTVSKICRHSRKADACRRFRILTVQYAPDLHQMRILNIPLDQYRSSQVHAGEPFHSQESQSNPRLCRNDILFRRI